MYLKKKTCITTLVDKITLLFLQSESGGTVLSTNWGEVGSKRVEVKPPDGMEYKKFEA